MWAIIVRVVCIADPIHPGWIVGNWELAVGWTVNIKIVIYDS